MVNFFVCSPSQLDANDLCSTGGTSAGADKPLTAGAGNTATADSNEVTANVVGKWCFRAEYKSEHGRTTQLERLESQRVLRGDGHDVGDLCTDLAPERLRHDHVDRRDRVKGPSLHAVRQR